jgi:hypothetical protein
MGTVLIAIGLVSMVLTVRIYWDLKRQSGLLSDFAKVVADQWGRDASRTQAVLELQRAAAGQAAVASSAPVHTDCAVAIVLGALAIFSGIGLFTARPVFVKLGVVSMVLSLIWQPYAIHAREQLRESLREQIRAYYTSVEEVTNQKLNWEERFGWNRDEHPAFWFLGAAVIAVIKVGIVVGLVHMLRQELRPERRQEAAQFASPP